MIHTSHKHSSAALPEGTDNQVLHQLRGLPQVAPGVLNDRRGLTERRRRWFWSLVYGSFNPRRRGYRRAAGPHVQLVDWHESHLLGVAICILLLCGADAFMTLRLLDRGAREMNPVMAAFVYSNVGTFTVVKMGLTSVGIFVMICLARYRFLRAVRVAVLLYLAMAGYAALIGYEVWMFDAISDTPLLS